MGDAAIIANADQIDSIVGVVVAGVGSDRRAKTITSFAEAAHHPCSVWIALEKATKFHDLVRDAGVFSLAILHARQESIARACDCPDGASLDRLPANELYQFKESFFFLENALACSVCEVERVIDFDDRSMFIAQIKECRVNSRRTHQPQMIASHAGLI